MLMTLHYKENKVKILSVNDAGSVPPVTARSYLILVENVLASASFLISGLVTLDAI